MLGHKDAIATIAVTDMTRATAFYEGILGLTPVGNGNNGNDETDAQQYNSGSTQVLVYKSQYAGTNKATAATWNVGGDIDRIVQALKAKGIAFEHYDLPDTKQEGDVLVAGSIRVAWIKDPDGNILALVNQ